METKKQYFLMDVLREMFRASREEREDRLLVEAPGDNDTSTELRHLGTPEQHVETSAKIALHGSGPVPPPQYGDATLKELIETPLFVALIEYLKDEHPEKDAPTRDDYIKTQEPSMKVPEHRERNLIWIDRRQWRINWIRRRVKLGGYLLFGLSLGLADSVMQWSFGGAFNCYQFPYYSFIGCLDASHSWEVVFILLIVAAGMIGA